MCHQNMWQNSGSSWFLYIPQKMKISHRKNKKKKCVKSVVEIFIAIIWTKFLLYVYHSRLQTVCTSILATRIVHQISVMESTVVFTSSCQRTFKESILTKKFLSKVFYCYFPGFRPFVHLYYATRAASLSHSHWNIAAVYVFLPKNIMYFRKERPPRRYLIVDIRTPLSLIRQSPLSQTKWYQITKL